MRPSDWVITALFCLMVASCIASPAHAATKKVAPIPTSDFPSEGVYVIDDPDNGNVCYVFKYGNGSGISCVARKRV
jgi:hypothetical protein